MSEPASESSRSGGLGGRGKPVDPMRSFRGVMVGTLILEAIVVLLALPVVAKLGAGVSTWQGIVVGALALALLASCVLVRRPGGMGVAFGLQLLMIGNWITLPALGILGVVFLLVWIYLWRLRENVAKRMAEGSLPSQQEQADS